MYRKPGGEMTNRTSGPVIYMESCQMVLRVPYKIAECYFLSEPLFSDDPAEIIVVILC